jgi:hypothetical protein
LADLLNDEDVARLARIEELDALDRRLARFLDKKEPR